MYKCTDPCRGSSLELQKNKYFENDEKACVYGDAFVFISKDSNLYDERGGVIYGHIQPEIWKNVRFEGEARDIIKCMARFNRPIAELESAEDASTGKGHLSRKYSTIKEWTKKLDFGKGQPVTKDNKGKSKSGQEPPTFKNEASLQYDAGSSPYNMKSLTAKSIVTIVPGEEVPTLQVVRLLCDASGMKLERPKLLKASSRGFKDRHCTSEEFMLGHVPNLSHSTTSTFKWSQCSLVSEPTKELTYDGQEQHVAYYMYKCQDSGSKLPRNAQCHHLWRRCYLQEDVSHGKRRWDVRSERTV